MSAAEFKGKKGLVRRWNATGYSAAAEAVAAQHFLGDGGELLIQLVLHETGTKG
jgi:hypothetical protein